MTAILLSARLHNLDRVKDRMRHSSKRLYPIARQSAGEVLEDVYLPRVKALVPIGRHFSDENQSPYRDGQPRRGGGLRKAIRVEPMSTSGTLARIVIDDDEDDWGVSARDKAAWVISGRQRRYLITPKNEKGILAFLWENVPASVIAKQRGKGGKRRVENRIADSYPANLVFFRYVRAGRYKANKFHEKAWDDVKDSLRRRLVDKVANKITFELE